MKGMALETIAQLTIVAVAALIAISLIIFYQDQIKEIINKLIHPDSDGGATTVNNTEFSTSQMRTYIITCWDKYKKVSFQGKICYFLMGDVSNVNTTALKDSLDKPTIVDISGFDITKDTTEIKTTRNGIIVESH